MKKLLLLISLLLFSLTSMAQQKIGHVSMNQVLASMPEVKLAESELHDRKKKLLQALQSKERELNQDLAEYQRTARTLSPTERQQTEQRLAKSRRNLLGRKQMAESDLKDMRNRLLLPILKKMLWSSPTGHPAKHIAQIRWASNHPASYAGGVSCNTRCTLSHPPQRLPLSGRHSPSTIPA